MTRACGADDIKNILHPALFRKLRFQMIDDKCKAGRLEDSKSGQFEEGRRGWKRCACLIHATGSVEGKFSRQSTGKSDWEQANSVAAAWESTGSWPPKGSPHEPKPVPALVPLPLGRR